MVEEAILKKCQPIFTIDGKHQRVANVPLKAP
jgi:hypothetical protein